MDKGEAIKIAQRYISNLIGSTILIKRIYMVHLPKEQIIRIVILIWQL